MVQIIALVDDGSLTTKIVVRTLTEIMVVQVIKDQRIWEVVVVGIQKRVCELLCTGNWTPLNISSTNCCLLFAALLSIESH